jgi:two-component system chemotaxis sensor kinase CheA
VVVCAEQGRQVGLVVEHILDVIEAAAEVLDHARGEGTLGAAVIGGQVTDLLDVPGLVSAAHPAPGGPAVAAGSVAHSLPEWAP